MTAYTVVIPTTGRDNLAVLLRALRDAGGPAPSEIIVVDDRPTGPALLLPRMDVPITIVRSGGRGPAAARNTGWRLAETEWIAFLDDDVVTGPEWPRQLARDLRGLGQDVGATQARIVVPLPQGREPTDAERGTACLADARWITADMAYRRTALAAVNGFDERFPRAYREDADLALRVCRAGFRIVRGTRTTTHPARTGDVLASVRAQRGNADDALMRHKHGPRWRSLAGDGRGRLALHALTTAAGMAALLFGAARKHGPAGVAAAGWIGLITEFAVRRILPGPRTAPEVKTMVLTSALIPPVACWHRLRGEWRVRRDRPATPAAVLFDRDDTLIFDVPYNGDPARVRPVPGADKQLQRLRDAGIAVGVVSNQAGVARGLITRAQLEAVNARVDNLLGPFGTWQVCLHGAGDGCACRKPAPGLVHRAAEALGVDVRRCVVIGDTEADVLAARAAGARGILVPSARTLPAEVERARSEQDLAPDLRSALELAGVR